MIFLDRLYLPEAQLTVEYGTLEHSAFWGRKNLTATRSRGKRKLEVTYVYTKEEFSNAEIDNNLSQSFVVPLYMQELRPVWINTQYPKLGIYTSLLEVGDYLYSPVNITETPIFDQIYALDRTTGVINMSDGSAGPTIIYPCITAKIENGTRTVRREATTGHILEKITFVETN